MSTVDSIAAVLAALAAEAALYDGRDAVRLALKGSTEAGQDHDAHIAEGRHLPRWAACQREPGSVGHQPQ